MDSILTDNLEENLKSLGYSDDSIAEKVRVIALTMDALEFTSDVREEVLTILLALNDVLKVSKEVNRGEWIPFVVGVNVVGDTARVAPNAYAGEAGAKHNGMVGSITGIRGGRVYIQYVGRNNGMGHNHPTQFVEVLKVDE